MKKQYTLIQRDGHNDPNEYIVRTPLEAAKIIDERDWIDDNGKKQTPADLKKFAKQLVKEEGFQGTDEWEFHPRTAREILLQYYEDIVGALDEKECKEECEELGIL